jgi:hypothetical protein
VSRWYGDARRPFPECDLAILWGSLHPKYDAVCETLGGTPRWFVQHGWLPKGSTVQLDPVGYDATAGWAQDPPCIVDGGRLKVSGSPMMVALQGDNYPGKDQFSPWFATVREFVAHLAEWSGIPMVLRRHPAGSYDLDDIVESCPLMTWDTHESVADSIAVACAVATRHSTVGLEAIAAGKPVLCYGNAVYRLPGVAYEMTASGEYTALVTGMVARGHCMLTTNGQRQALRWIKSHQWALDEFPAVLRERLWTLASL